MLLRETNAGESGEENLRAQGVVRSKIEPDARQGRYFPLFRYSSNAAQGRQLMTLSFSTHALRAWATPNLAKLRAVSS
jgi:hypothetical protein